MNTEISLFFSQHQCIIECMVDLHMEICGCNEINTFVYFESEIFPADQFCAPIQAYECGKIKLNKTEISDKCFDPEECKDVCEYWSYESSVTVAPIVRRTFEQSVENYKNTNKSYRKVPNKKNFSTF